MIKEKVQELILRAINGKRKITFLVGAGLSAESGIPIFRGKEGYWTNGSKNYTPQEIGTKKMFVVNSDEVWRWYLFRMSTCNRANPNEGHILLSKIEKELGNKFSLISQNVDGLHFRKESKISNLFLIHGDLRYMRCSEECSNQLYKIPIELINQKRTRDTPFTYKESELLKCPNCGDITRPHVLWFDEYYNDKFYNLNKVLRIAKETGLLLVIGTSGATNLPMRIVENTVKRQGVVIDVNPNENEFTDKLERLKNGYTLRSTSSEFLKDFFDILMKSKEKNTP